MNPVYIIALIGVAILVYVVYSTFTSSKKITQIRANRETKRTQIILQYEKEMYEELNNLVIDPQLYKTIKTEILMRINRELSTNIFFDEQSTKEAIKRLSLFHPSQYSEPPVIK